ncbi:MAG: aminoglycoside phosphotransferase family protein [Clostridia bacterium]|nr:aminoglycoside phosphotransferase family protein [Clostridia bacterium]
MKAENMIGHFQISGQVSEIRPYGNGNINDTFRVETVDGAYLLQRVNTEVFKVPEEVQSNIERVTAYLKEQIIRENGDPRRETLTPVPCTGGGTGYRDESGRFWRVFTFIDNTRSCSQPASLSELVETGLAFGRFERRLSGFPADSLYETIPAFHDTPARVQQMLTAANRDACGRKANVLPELRMLTDRKDRADLFVKAFEDGRIPRRVVHNDTKTANALLDAETGRAICVCDLDTVMPGFAAYDFGDGIRSGASTAAEDEPDLTKVSLSLEKAGAFARGYLEEVGGVLTKDERELLPDGIWMITYEQAMRFLADYLNGDTYYKTAYAEHNLVRTRNQITLLREIEGKEADLRQMISG